MNPVGVSVTGAGPGAVAPEASVRLWLVRHGETEWSRVLRHTGWTDVPLTDRGREQAAALAEPLRGIAFAAVLCSPLGRARETLRLARPDLEAELLDDLRERNYGVAEGRSTEQLREQDPDWNSWTTPIEGAETIDEVGVRANRAIARAVACGRAAADGGSASEVRDVLLVAHGHLLRILAARWIGQPGVLGSHLGLDVGAVSLLGHERERRVLLRWNVATGAAVEPRIGFDPPPAASSAAAG